MEAQIKGAPGFGVNDCLNDGIQVIFLLLFFLARSWKCNGKVMERSRKRL